MKSGATYDRHDQNKSLPPLVLQTHYSLVGRVDRRSGGSSRLVLEAVMNIIEFIREHNYPLWVGCGSKHWAFYWYSYYAPVTEEEYLDKMWSEL